MAERVHLVRDVLDKQLLDRDRRHLGRADGILLEVRPGEPPRVVAVEVGAVTLASRLSGRLGRWLMRRIARRRRQPRDPVRFGWGDVREVTTREVVIDVSAEESRVLAWERWLRTHVVARIPGG